MGLWLVGKGIDEVTVRSASCGTAHDGLGVRMLSSRRSPTFIEVDVFVGDLQSLNCSLIAEHIYRNFCD